MICFTIPGAPTPKGRPRSFRTKSGGIGHYTPQKTRTHEAAIRSLCLEASEGRGPISGPVCLSVCAYMPVPESWPEWKRDMAHRGVIMPTGKPDIDNIAKAVMDAMNGIAWSDDSQVYSVHMIKIFAACGDDPRTEVVARSSDSLPSSLSSKRAFFERLGDPDDMEECDLYNIRRRMGEAMAEEWDKIFEK